MKPPPDEAIRARVRTDFATTLVLEAGAGTGKTTVLVDRLVNLVVSGTATLDRIVAITFTEAAAQSVTVGRESRLIPAQIATTNCSQNGLSCG